MSMEMLFAVLGGLFISLGVHFMLPHRTTRGLFLLCAIGTAVTAVVWTALTWLEWPFDGGWIWVVSIASGPLVAILTGLLLNRRRPAADEKLFHRLAKA